MYDGVTGNAGDRLPMSIPGQNNQRAILLGQFRLKSPDSSSELRRFSGAALQDGRVGTNKCRPKSGRNKGDPGIAAFSMVL
jgi:hypothetical protein